MRKNTKRKPIHRRSVLDAGKRVLCGVLCTAMITQSGADYAMAATQKTEEPPVYLTSSRIAQDKLPEGHLLYFGTASATVPERGEYAIKIYREGNLDKKVSVDIHTVDMTATYGEDYELNEKDVEDLNITGEKKTILEKYVKGQKITNLSEAEIGSLSIQAGSEAEEAETAEPITDFSLNVGKNKKTAASISSLAAEKEAQTGEATREVSDAEKGSASPDEEQQGLIDAVMETLAMDAMENLQASSTSTVTFEEGQREKTIRFSILEDDESEGTEGFTLVLANPEGAEIYQVGSAGIAIEDDDKQVKSEVSFTKSEYDSKDGKVTLTVQRTGAEYSVCDMQVITSGDTAVAGENYEEKNETLAFAPYEMEKTIEMEVSGQGKFSVLLSELKACTEGKYTKAVVNIQSEKASGKGTFSKGTLKKAENDKQKFAITIDGKSYTVEYTMGDTSGKIIDDSYTSPVEVGVYYFSLDKEHGGNFEYGYFGGDKPSSGGWRSSEYHYDVNTTDTMDNNYGLLEYYSPTLWHNGYSKTISDQFIPGLYFQYLTPDWASINSNCTGHRAKVSTNWNQQETYLRESIVKKSFDRTQDNAVITLDDGKTRDIEVAVYDENWESPANHMEFYGICAMYRKLNISVENPSELTYINGKDSTVSMRPANITVECGVWPNPLESGLNTRDVYANLSADDTNFVFSVGNMSLNNQNGIYGYINGYDITLDPGKVNEQITVSYPQGFKDYLNDEVKKSSHEADLDFSSSAVDAEIKKIDSSMKTVPYDAYFFAWISSIQKATAKDGLGYRQNLIFKPIMQHYDVDVEVLPPSTGETIAEGAAHFTDENLSSTGKKTYHAGDKLDLSMVCDDTDNYRVDGYEVSTDGGTNFNTVRNTNELFLQYDLEHDRGYQIRPHVVAYNNAVEICFAGDAADRFEIQDLIPQSKLENTEFAGKNILNLNPNETDVTKMAEPEAGKEYTVRVLVKSEDSTYAYRPVIKHRASGKSYTTQYYTFVAKGQPGDNIIDVSVDKVKKSDLKTYTVKGTLFSNIASIRQNGEEINKQKLPVCGYTMSVGTGTQSESAKKTTGEVIMQPDSTISTTDGEGEYILSGITGKTGDMIPVCISNGIVNGQVVDVVLADGIKAEDGSQLVNVPSTEIFYPYGAPKVTSIDYTYGKSENAQNQGGNIKSGVHIYDDTFYITANVNTAGRSIKEAVFTVYHYGQEDSYAEYRVATNSANKSVFKCEIPKMSEVFHDGDGIKIRLVDNEYQTLDVAKNDENGNPITDDDGNFVQGQQVAIEYPDVDTGLTFYTESVKKSPQTYDLENSPTVNVPIIGSAIGNTSSGLLVFGTTYWDDTDAPAGYTMQIGVDALFNMTAAPTTEDKLKGYQNMHATGKRVAELNKASQEADSLQDTFNAEDFIFKMGDGSLLGEDADGDAEQGANLKAYSNMLDEKTKMQTSIEAMKKDASSQAKAAKAGLNKKGNWSIDTALVLAFDFVRNPETNSYVFSCGTVAIGGTFNFNKTKYTIISSVPCFINFSSTMQLNVTVSYPTPEGANALSAGAFEGYVGNLADRLSYASSSMNLMVSGKVQVGVGMCGVLSARGYASIKLQFDIPLTEDRQGGFLINAAGGVGFDLLVISINFDIVNATWGFGSLESKTSFSFFGGMVSAGKSSGRSLKKAGSVRGGDTLLKTISENESVVMHPYSGGTADMSKFGKNNNGLKKAALKAVSYDILLENAAERTRPQIISLDGDQKMMVFLANRVDNKEYDTVLNYSIYDGKNWSEPKAVAEDNTTDSTPNILRAGDKVVIAWADANRKFADEEDIFDMLNAMGISVAVYDITSGEMGQEISLVDDNYFNLSPKLNMDGTKIYCSYMKRDLTKMETEADLTTFDGDKTYTTMAYATYDYSKGESEEQQFISIKHDKITDPLALDYTARTTVVNGKTYMLATYTVDEDNDLNTNEDRELFLSITNLTDDRSYYPIRISDDNVAQASPQLTDIDGIVYFTWLEDGYIFHLVNASDLLGALFDENNADIEVSVSDDGTETKKFTIDKSKYISGYMTEGNDNKDWYKKAAAELGIDEEYYKGSIYDKLAGGSFPSESANFNQNIEKQTSIDNYKLVTNGDDIYIFFTDCGTDENTADSPASVEIYGVRYQRMMEDDDSSENLWNEDKMWGFGKAVQITKAGKVIDELDLYMSEDSSVHAVSNFFDQWIDENGQIQYSANKLVEIEFGTENSMEIVGENINLPTRLVAGATENITFAVENAGLLTSKGFDYQVVQVTDGQETEIAKEHMDAVLNAGESVNITVPWTIPENLSNTAIRVTLKETGVSQNTPYTLSRDVSYGSKLFFEDAEVILNGQQPYVNAKVKNIGNAPSEAYTGALVVLDDDDKEKKVYKSFDLPALASGEEKAFTIPFTPDVEDFNSLGIAKLLVKVTNGDNTVVQTNTRLVSSRPVCARINDGKTVELRANGKTTLKTIAAPWNSIAGTVKYASEDPTVAVVGDNGELIANKIGTTTIHAYYPKTGVSASIPVKVSETAATAASGTSAIKAAKSSVVIAAGKTKSVKYTVTKDASASKAAAVTASVSDKKVISKATVSGSKVKITVAKAAKKGATAMVTLSSVNAAGKTVKAKIKVTVQNKVKKLTVKKKKVLKLNKGKKGKVTLKVTAQNNKKAATDIVRISSKKLSLVKYSVKKGEIILTLKGKKKGKEKITVKMGSKKAKLTVKVK